MRLALHIRVLCGAVCGLLLAVALVQAPDAHAQTAPAYYDYPRPDLDWYEIETPHFRVLFHADTAGVGPTRTAQAVARIAEDIYAPITELYGHEPDGRVAIILKDFEDYSNGAAYFFDDKIEIWAPALDSPLRGDGDWLRNVITHEFTHIVQVQTSMKAGRRVPFLYLQWLDYEDVKRPDVLYGFPNVLVTYPVATLSNPAWLAEGTAQYQRAGLHYDRWDTHRDMLLRTRVLAGDELTLAEMGGFYSHTSLMREGVYNHGFAFVRYLAQTYGEDALPRVTRALSDWKNVNVERAIDDALGVPGGAVYRTWMDSLGAAYRANTSAVRARLHEGEIVEGEGFANYHPVHAPDGRRLAYVSNRGEDFSRTALYVRDLDGGDVAVFDLPGAAAVDHVCALGHRLVAGVGGAVSWRPDGGAIVYARTADTPRGDFYSDLYEIDLETEEITRLTHNARAADPAVAPDDARIAFVTSRDGTSNLRLLTRATDEITLVTRFDDGSQVTDPAWSAAGDWIYFARLGRQGRDLWRVRPDGTGLGAVLATDADERSPAPAPDGTALVYASDRSGIFNLYRVPLGPDGLPAQDAAEAPLTNVLGGAFMPDVATDGAVAFARYESDGYRIARIARPAPLEALPAYRPPAVTAKPETAAQADASWGALNAADDADLGPLPGSVVRAVRTEGRFALGATEDARDDASADTLEVRPYELRFTSFSFYPTVRLDRYVGRDRSRFDGALGRRGVGEMLLRNTKVGLYASSREVLEDLTLMAGLLVAPASTEPGSVGGFLSPTNLLEMERDAFLQVEYLKGLPFLPRRWSPQLGVSMYNVRRNVESGLSIEEFPCTACFPDTTYADLSYSLWELDLYARSKINRTLLLEAGYRYSPYRVTTQRFYSLEADQSIAPSSARYYIGRAYRARAYFDARRPHRHDDVVPEGVRATAGYEHEPGRLLRSFDIEQGALVPTYERFAVHRLSLDARFGTRLPGRVRGGVHGVGLRLRATTILGGAVDSFFDDYVGGLTGARGYPFYALGGNETLWLQASYHVPIFPDVARQVLFTYVDKVYARVYADAAMAWSGGWPGADGVRPDVGVELRAALGSFYLLPTAVFASATYGLDEFDYALDDGFLAPDGRAAVTYGRELQWHFGVVFAFDDL